MKNLLARLALLGSIAAFVAAASSAFAQDKPPAPGVVAVLWVIYGYSIAFTAGSNPFWGSLDKLFMLGEDPASAVAATFSKGQYLPDFVYCMFQLTFAAITVALICGGYAERFKFSA